MKILLTFSFILWFLIFLAFAGKYYLQLNLNREAAIYALAAATVLVIAALVLDHKMKRKSESE